MKQYFLLCFLLISSVCFGQKLEVKKKVEVAINNLADSNYRVRVADPAKDTVLKKEQITYDAKGQILSFQQTKNTDWSKSVPFLKDSIVLPVALQAATVLLADIKPEEGRLMVYFWPYTSNGKILDNEANSFFKEHEFSIPLEDRTNLSFYSSAVHFGALTLPLKVYLGAPDSASAVQAATSVGLYVGRKWGTTKFVKLPTEKEFTTYQSNYSLNGFAGLNALELSESNTSDKGSRFKGNVTTLSLGVSGGWHYKTFSLFVAVGQDIPLTEKADNWLLKKSLWIGFGAGFEIF